MENGIFLGELVRVQGVKGWKFANGERLEKPLTAGGLRLWYCCSGTVQAVELEGVGVGCCWMNGKKSHCFPLGRKVLETRGYIKTFVWFSFLRLGAVWFI